MQTLISDVENGTRSLSREDVYRIGEEATEIYDRHPGLAAEYWKVMGQPRDLDNADSKLRRQRDTGLIGVLPIVQGDNISTILHNSPTDRDLLMHSVLLSVTTGAARGESVEGLIGQAGRDTSLEFTDSERAYLARLGRQAAVGGLTRFGGSDTGDIDLVHIVQQVRSAEDVTRLALVHGIVHPQDFAALQAGVDSGRRWASPNDLRSAFQLIREGATVEDAARRAGVMQENGFIHEDDDVWMHSQRHEVANNSGPEGPPGRVLRAFNQSPRGASVEDAAGRAGVTRPDGSIHPEDLDVLRAAVADRAGPRAGTDDLVAALDDVRGGASIDDAARRANVTRQDGSIHPEDLPSLQAAAVDRDSPQAPPDDLRTALHHVRNGASVEDAARRAGVMRQNGSIHSNDLAWLHSQAAEVADNGGPGTSPGDVLTAFNRAQEDASVDEAARRAGVTRGDGSPSI